MKKTFMKWLPIAAAVLLATSCSKDENSAVVDEVVPPEPAQESVDNTIKTITITGKIGKETLSKVTLEGSNLAFQVNDEFVFGTEGDDNVYGSIIITATDGSYTATVNFPNETALLDDKGFSATKGTEPIGLSAAYSDLESAVADAYYEVPFKVIKDGNSYALKRTKDGDGDILVYIQSAFINVLGTKSTKLDNNTINAIRGKYYIIPVGKTMGSGTKTTVAGKIYKIGSADDAPDGFVDLGIIDNNGKTVYWKETNTYDATGWSAISNDDKANMPQSEDFVALWNNCYWQMGSYNGQDGYFVFLSYAVGDCQKSNPSGHTYSETSGDPFIFFPTTKGVNGNYWSSTLSGQGKSYILNFSTRTGNVRPNYSTSNGNNYQYAIRYVSRSE